MAPEPSTSGPDGEPGVEKRRWAPCPEIPTTDSPGYCVLGFMPEGATYFDYAVTTNGPSATEFFVDAVSDIDGDGVLSHHGLRMAATKTVDGPPAPFSVLRGALGCEAVLSSSGEDQLYDSPGPCAEGMGRTIF